MQIDLELALTDFGSVSIREIEGRLPIEFYAEDRADKGWGLVVRTSRALPMDLDSAISAFLSPLHPLEDIIRQAGTVLRVGIFHDTVTCTLQIKSCKKLAAMEIGLEVSIYPCSEDEAT